MRQVLITTETLVAVDDNFMLSPEGRRQYMEGEGDMHLFDGMNDAQVIEKMMRIYVEASGITDLPIIEETVKEVWAK